MFSQDTTYSDPPPIRVKGCLELNEAENECINGTTKSTKLVAYEIKGEIKLKSLKDNENYEINITLVYSSEFEVGLNGAIELSEELFKPLRYHNQ